MTGYAFPDMLVDLVRLQREGRRDEAHDLFDAHLPLIRYELADELTMLAGAPIYRTPALTWGTK